MKGDSVGELLTRVLAIGLVAALVPVPILIVLVILAGPSGLSRAWWFVLGFAGSLLVAGAVGLFVASEAGVAFDSTVISAIGLILGVAFLFMAARFALQQRGHKGLAGANARTLSELSRGRVVALGVVAGALNPKTLPIFLTGVAAIAGDGQPALTRSLALALLTGTASVGVALPPMLLTVAPGTHTTRALERVRRRVEPHATVVAILLLALIGLAYLAFGVAGLR